MSPFKDLYTACLGTGSYKYIDKYYEINTSTKNPKVVNIQLRYWVEAVERFYNLKEKDYNENTIEEGVLIINLLANSLAILGGMNDKTKNAEHHYLLDFYSGCAWDLKNEKPDLYETLEDLNKNYTKISKHMIKSRTKCLKDISYKKIKKYFETTKEIWKWILSKKKITNDVEALFNEPHHLLNKSSKNV